jgi:hypothetical protein
VIARDLVIGKDENLITDRHRYHGSGAGNLADKRLGHIDSESESADQ